METNHENKTKIANKNGNKDSNHGIKEQLLKKYIY